MTSRISQNVSSVPIRTEGAGQTSEAQRADLFVLDSVDGMSSVEELAMMLAMDEGEVLKILTHLSDLKLVRWEETEERSAEATESDEGVAQWRHDDAEIREGITSEVPDFEDDADETFRFITAPATESWPEEVDAEQQAQSQAAQPKVEPPPPAQRKASKIERPPPVPPSLPPPRDPSLPRRDVVKTPRQHLDTSWWKSDGITQEPDEVLTSREISNSGLRFALKSPPIEEPAQVTMTSRDDIITDRIDPVSGSIEVDETIGEPDVTQQLARPQIVDAPAKTPESTAEKKRRAKAGMKPVVDEVAHTRRERAPLLPDIEYDDKWSTEDEETAVIDRRTAWKEEAMLPSLKADSGQWSVDEARCISYFLRLIEHGSYYDIFGVDKNADRETIAAAAESITRFIDFYSLDLRGSAVGKESLRKVQNGIQRALDVLQSSDSRAQYDAALEALAAFKLS